MQSLLYHGGSGAHHLPRRGSGDERAAMEKAGQILEAAVRQEHEHEEERREDKRRAAEQRRWQRELARARSRESGHSQETLLR